MDAYTICPPHIIGICILINVHRDCLNLQPQSDLDYIFLTILGRFIKTVMQSIRSPLNLA